MLDWLAGGATTTRLAEYPRGSASKSMRWPTHLLRKRRSEAGHEKDCSREGSGAEGCGRLVVCMATAISIPSQVEPHSDVSGGIGPADVGERWGRPSHYLIAKASPVQACRLHCAWLTHHGAGFTLSPNLLEWPPTPARKLLSVNRQRLETRLSRLCEAAPATRYPQFLALRIQTPTHFQNVYC